MAVNFNSLEKKLIYFNISHNKTLNVWNAQEDGWDIVATSTTVTQSRERMDIIN